VTFFVKAKSRCLFLFCSFCFLLDPFDKLSSEDSEEDELPLPLLPLPLLLPEPELLPDPLDPEPEEDPEDEEELLEDAFLFFRTGGPLCFVS
jgi:hypothetical protein